MHFFLLLRLCNPVGGVRGETFDFPVESKVLITSPLPPSHVWNWPLLPAKLLIVPSPIENHERLVLQICDGASGGMTLRWEFLSLLIQ